MSSAKFSFDAMLKLHVSLTREPKSTGNFFQYLYKRLMFDKSLLNNNAKVY